MQATLSQFRRLRGVAQTPEAWSLTPGGRYLLRRERELVDGLVAELFGYFALQLGDAHRDLLAGSPVATRARLGRGQACGVRCELHSLPFAASTVDLVVIAHALEFAPQPEAVMRESFRILRPEGNLLVIGFNPAGLHGLRWRLDFTGGYPWHGRFVRPARVRDWFAVLGLTQVHGLFLGYAPFGGGGGEHQRGLWEAAGDRWWPLLGGAYILHAVKRQPAMRRLRPNWRDKRAGAGAPATVTKRGQGA